MSHISGRSLKPIVITEDEDMDLGSLIDGGIPNEPCQVEQLVGQLVEQGGCTTKMPPTNEAKVLAPSPEPTTEGKSIETPASDGDPSSCSSVASIEAETNQDKVPDLTQNPETSPASSMCENGAPHDPPSDPGHCGETEEVATPTEPSPVGPNAQDDSNDASSNKLDPGDGALGSAPGHHDEQLHFSCDTIDKDTSDTAGPSSGSSPGLKSPPKCDEDAGATAPPVLKVSFDSIESPKSDPACDGPAWILPTPAAPGDHLSRSLHRTPSKSILKKTSSYHSLASDHSYGSSSRGGMSAILRKVPSLASSMDLSSSSSRSLSGRQMSSATLHSSSVGFDIDSSTHSQKSRVNFNPTTLPTFSEHPADDAAGTPCDVATGDDTGDDAGAVEEIKPKVRRGVSFNSVSVREYDRTIGDNPSCRSGPPLGLDWSYSMHTERPVDDFESQRAKERVTHVSGLHMNKFKRKNMLAMNWGHTEEEMKEARRQTRQTQFHRSMTKTLIPLYRMQELYYGVKRLFSRKKSKQRKSDGELSGCSTTEDSSPITEIASFSLPSAIDAS